MLHCIRISNSYFYPYISDESYLSNDNREQKKQRAQSKASRQAELKRWVFLYVKKVAEITDSICLIYSLRIAQEIQREQEEIEVQLRDLEARGVMIEKELRGEEQSPDM